MTTPAPPRPARARSKWLAHPWWSLLLAATWLLLQNSLAPVHILAAIAIGLVLPRLLHAFLPLPTTALSPTKAVYHISLRPVSGLIAVVLLDILKSNVIVAMQALGRMDMLRPAWIQVPLDAKHPQAISLLATIITTTPGTISCDIDEARGNILVHVLHCTDAAAAVAIIKQRYESRLMQIFRVVSTEAATADAPANPANAVSSPVAAPKEHA